MLHLALGLFQLPFLKMLEMMLARFMGIAAKHGS